MNNQPVEIKIKEWIESQGYPLEIDVAEKFKQHEFEVNQSEYYKDDETGKFREIDVIATYNLFVNNPLRFYEVTLVAECKYSPQKPWILFSNDVPKGFRREVNNLYRPYTDAANEYMSFLEHKHEDEIYNLPLFQYGKRISYNLTQAFTQNIDVAYSALSSAIKALIYKKRLSNEQQRFGIFFPVIFVGGELFECFHDKGDLVVNSIDHGVLYWKSSIFGENHFLIHIVKSTFTEKFIENSKLTARKFTSFADKKHKEFDEYIKSTNGADVPF